MVKKWIGAVALAIIAGGMAVAQGGRLPPECRKEILKICPIGGGARECLRTVLPRLSDHCRNALNDRLTALEKRHKDLREIEYGPDPKQRLDLLKPATATDPLPILFFVHGGGWSIGDKGQGQGARAPWAVKQGWAFVSANYRLVPQATVEQQAADLASALAWLRANAAAEGLDPDRIVLMGHSSGAHLTALLGTDERYLNAAAVPIAAIRGIVLLDGAGYDVPAQIASEGNLARSMYDAAFGSDPARQSALSPITHVAAPNVVEWLIIPVAHRQDSSRQSEAFAAALRGSGAAASVMAVRGKTHRRLNRGIGESGDAATKEVERFMARVR